MQRKRCALPPLVLLAICVPAGAQTSREYVLDIPRLPRDAALRALALQTGFDIGTLQPSEQMVQPLRGRYTIEAAFTQMLAGSGFTFQRVDDTTFNVLQSSSTATLDTTRAPSPLQRRDLNELHTQPLEEVISIGYRIQDAATDADFVVRLGRAEIDHLGAAALSDVMKYLPQQPYVFPEGPNGWQCAELRGLGATTTLINGRWAAQTAGSVGCGFDLNTIPVSAIERVEVLHAPSTVLGAAVGGVVNIVLRSDIEGLELQTRYGSAQGGAEEQRASLSAGETFGALRASLVLDYFDRGRLLGEERERWRDQDFRRYGSYDQRTSTGNVTSPFVGNLPGLQSPFAAIPDDGATTPADFASTDGLRNAISEYQFVSIVPATRRSSALGSLELALSGGVEAFAELLWAERFTTFRSGPPRLYGVVVPASNAFNPFGIPVFLDMLLTSIGPSEIATQMALARAVFGLRGQFGAWRWEAAALRSEEDATVRTTNQLNPQRLAAALASPDPATALNVFQSRASGSPELLESFVEQAMSRYSSAGSEFAISLQGSLFELADDVVSATIGAQWRRESMSFDGQLPASFSRNVAAGFAEVQIPLSRKIRLSLGGRFDSGNDWGIGFTSQYAIVWDPVEPLQLKVSYGSALRPPSMDEVQRPDFFVTAAVSDPRRDNQVTLVTARVGGNPQLNPSIATVLNAAAVWEPASLPGTQLTLTCWRIQMDDRIRIMPLSELVADEALHEARVERFEPTPADVAAGLPGVLRTLDVTPVNAGRAETSGVDVDVAYGLDTRWGRFTTRTVATWVDRFDTTDSPRMPVTHRVGVASPLGTIAKWHAVTSLEWGLPGMSLSTRVRYVPRYHDTYVFNENGRAVPAQAIVDVRASLDVGSYFERRRRRGLELTAGVLNVFNQKAPFAEVGTIAGYDPSQGDLKQLFAYLQISKQF